jgi:hypothetical protein
MSTRTGDEILLLGPPRSVSGLVPMDVSKSSLIPVSISIGKESTVYRGTLRAGVGGGEIRLQLPPGTPPGVYPGETTLDGKARRLRVQVEPVMRINVQPKQTTLSTGASSSVEFAVTVVNDGNVPFEIPKADVFDLDDGVAQERALGRTLRARLAQGEHRIDRYFDELKDGHGGEAHVAVRRGAGPLSPGETRELACLLDVPPTAKVGRSYAGPWRLGDTAHVIVADIKAGAPPVKAKRRR